MRASDPVRRFAKSHLQFELLAHANGVDPGINLELVRTATGASNVALDERLGEALARVSEVVEHRDFSDVFVFPFLARGGAERYLFEVMRESIARTNRPVLVVVGEPFLEHAWVDRLPASAVFLDLVAIRPELEMDERIDLLSCIVRACRTGTRIHLKQSRFSDAFYDRCADELSAFRAYFYRFCDPVTTHGGLLVEHGIGTDFISRHLDALAGVVSDHEHNVVVDRARFGIHPEKWHTLLAKTDTSGPSRRPTERRELKVLWASRLDRQKRPDLLLGIARRLIAIGETAIHLDVFGVAQLDDFDEDELRKCPNVRFHGGYSSFVELVPSSYDVFLYTSSHDGIPQVLLEAGAAGLPAIAPALGGIPEIVVHEDTGWLVDPSGSDAEVVDRYVARLVELAASREQLDLRSSSVRARVVARHGPDSFARAYRTIYGEDLSTTPIDTEHRRHDSDAVLRWTTSYHELSERRWDERLVTAERADRHSRIRVGSRSSWSSSDRDEEGMLPDRESSVVRKFKKLRDTRLRFFVDSPSRPLRTFGFVMLSLFDPDGVRLRRR